MAFAPVLVLRKRGAQTMREVLKKIVKGLSEGKCIPRGIRNLCGSPDESDGQNGPHCETAFAPDEILFPLPTNDEQLAIVRRLCGRSGVLVQGPPGTGKSHTIVNLICHLLASGKRVLVTSQTPRALKVLRDKIAKELPEILPLTVSLLGEDAESRQNLEYCVSGILRHVTATNLSDTQRQIEATARDRNSLQSRLADLRRRLREIREAETTAYSIPGTPYQGTAQTVAQAAADDSECLSWLTDHIAEGAEPPLTDEEFRELYTLWEQCRNHSLAHALPELDTLPTADDFEKAIGTCSQAQDVLTQFGEKLGAPSAQGLGALERGQLQQLCKIAQQYLQLSDWLAKRTDLWIARVRQEVFAGRALTWISLESATSKALKSLADLADERGDEELQAPAGVSRAQILADAADLLSHFESRRGLGFWIFRAHVVKQSEYLWRHTRFAGRQCNSPSVLKSLVAHLQAQDTLDRTWQEWSDIVEGPKGTMRHRAACLEHCRDILKAILQLGNLVSTAEKVRGETKGNAKATGGADWGQELLDNVRAALARLDVRDAQAVFSGITDRVSQCRHLENPHPVVNDLATAAERGGVEDYREQLTRLAALHRERSLAERCLSLDKRLRELAPILADTIKSVATRPALTAHLDSLGRAWAWKRATAWLERFAAEHSASVADEITETERQLQDKTQTLVALKAWTSCIENLTSDQQGALVAWQQAVYDIGAGHGRHAETYRREARRYLQQCRRAIPVWIMPLHRVAEQIEVEPSAFDVVIVDEASQTGPDGLILQYLAEQCIIVGDNKQISPEAVGINQGEVTALIEQHLADIQFAERLRPTCSLFEQAAIRYGNRITLREHFRCMPEIIRFSNELCYTDTTFDFRCGSTRHRACLRFRFGL